MLTKSTTISKGVRVGKFVGVGFLVVNTSRGDVKMYHGDHLVEVDYTRPARPNEPSFIKNVGPKETQATVAKTHVFVVTEDAARALGIHLKETVEAENERLEVEAAAKKVADAEAAEKKAAEELAKKLATVPTGGVVK